MTSPLRGKAALAASAAAASQSTGSSPRSPKSFALSQESQTRLFKNWSKPINELPVFKDVPRLIRGVKIFNADGSVIFEDDGSREKKQLVVDFMLELAHQLHEKDVAALVKEEAQTAFSPNPEDDIQNEMKRWLLATKIDRNCKLFRVLKCIQQEIVVSPVMEMRKVLYASFPYKDVMRSWKVEITFTDDGCVVTHRKQESSHSLEPDEGFTFEWSFEMKFSKKVTFVTGDINITEYTLAPDMKQAMKDDLERLLKTFIKPTQAYRNLLNRPVASVGIGPHLLKISDNIHLKDKNRRFLFTRDPALNKVDNFWQFVTDLATHLGDASEIEELITKVSAVPETQPRDHIRLFFNEAKDHLKTIKLLKALHPDLVRHAEADIAATLKEKNLPFADSRENWKVSICIEGHRTIVTHYNVASGRPHFELSWRLVLTFNPALTQFKAKAQIDDWQFFGKPPMDIQMDLKKCLDPWVAPTTHYSRILARDNAEYQVHLSLPKLAGSTVVFHGDRKVFSGGQEEEVSFGLLQALTRALIPSDKQPDMLQAIEDSCKQAVKKEEGQSKLKEHLRVLLSKPEFESSPVFRLLKCFDRQILVPSIVEFREKLAPVAAYRAKDFWKVRIEIDAHSVRISHERQETSESKAGEQGTFEWTWRFSLAFDPAVNKVKSCELHIIDWDFSSALSSDLVARIKDSFAPYVTASMPYQRIYRSPLFKSSFSVGGELTTCARFIKLFNNEHAELYSCDMSTPKEVAIKKFMTALIKLLIAPEKQNETKLKFANSLETKGKLDAGLAVDHFLKSSFEDKSLDDQQPLVKFIKCIMQSILAPATLSLRRDYYDQFPFKPMKGSWRIRATFNAETGVVSILHKKREQSIEQEASEYFDFEWHLKLNLNLNKDALTTEFKINEFNFHQEAKGDKKASVVNAFHNIVRDSPDAISGSVASLQAIELLELVQQAVYTLKKPLKIQSTALAGTSVDLILTSVIRTLKEVGTDTVPLVNVPVIKRRATSQENLDLGATATGSAPNSPPNSRKRSRSTGRKREKRLSAQVNMLSVLSSTEEETSAPVPVPPTDLALPQE